MDKDQTDVQACWCVRVAACERLLGALIKISFTILKALSLLLALSAVPDIVSVMIFRTEWSVHSQWPSLSKIFHSWKIVSSSLAILTPSWLPSTHSESQCEIFEVWKGLCLPLILSILHDTRSLWWESILWLQGMNVDNRMTSTYPAWNEQLNPRTIVC